jgi:hypothetical protein
VFETKPTLIFQVDLWSARGELPGTLAEVSPVKKKSGTQVELAPAPIASSMSSAYAGR